MSRTPTDLLGWTATTVFVASYFFSRASLLRLVQMAGAALWISYGCLIGAWPVIVANIMVFSAAAWTLLRALPSGRRAAPPAEATNRLA